MTKIPLYKNTREEQKKTPTPHKSALLIETWDI